MPPPQRAPSTRKKEPSAKARAAALHAPSAAAVAPEAQAAALAAEEEEEEKGEDEDEFEELDCDGVGGAATGAEGDVGVLVVEPSETLIKSPRGSGMGWRREPRAR